MVYAMMMYCYSLVMRRRTWSKQEKQLARFILKWSMLHVCERAAQEAGGRVYECVYFVRTDGDLHVTRRVRLPTSLQ